MTSYSMALAQPVLTRSSLNERVWWMAFGGLCVLLLAPLLVVDVPPLVDYPNHLARAFILASLPQDPFLSRFYMLHWAIIPNLALDLLAPPLMHLLPVHVVGRLLIALAVMLPVLGTVAYNTALGGRWWSLGVGLVAYNSCLLYGFLNFSVSLGLALLLAAGWLRWREDRPVFAIALAIIGAPALLICHLMGLVFFGLLIGGTELFRVYQSQNRHFIGALFARGAILMSICAIPAGLYIVSALEPLGGDAGFLPFTTKLLQLPEVFVNYSQPLDLAAAGVSGPAPLGCLLLRQGRVPGPAACTIALLLIGFLAMPYAWKGTSALDTRFTVMLGFMAFAGFVPGRWPVAFGQILASVVLLLMVARMALLTTAWAARQADIMDLRTVLATVSPGQAVYVAKGGLKEAPAYWAANRRWRLLSDGLRTDDHLGALVVIEHRAYWPFEFDIPSQQPIQTRQPYRNLAMHIGSLPRWAEAANADVCGFDYVLLMEADAVPPMPAERFRLLVRSGFAALYTITKCKPDPITIGLLPPATIPDGSRDLVHPTLLKSAGDETGRLGRTTVREAPANRRQRLVGGCANDSGGCSMVESIVARATLSTDATGRHALW